MRQEEKEVSEGCVNFALLDMEYVLMLYFSTSHNNVFIDCVKMFDYPKESIAITELPLSSPISTDTARTYDLSGRKVTTLKKGLYIRNGKKFFKN